MATQRVKKTVKDKKVKRDKKVEAFGIVHIKASFNNTIVTITDRNGNTLSWASAGLDGDYKSSKKSTPFAAQIASEKASKKAFEMGVREVDVYVKGPGMGRESSIRAIESSGLKVKLIKDVTPMPHNGCRPKKRRRI
ncbi:30S ribosomal protein S11 [Brachyspira aalborgi]|uniref:Small ribosomal subunit protein uS11 n=1 Tax=Brachyspira aalborgi TaxID=29522 RepID=A0A5C8CF15_9SPIR|nr:30S ribosomal protein S11 [Brachyspira aalborgi]TXJ12064.1 30S ribosomal protein S11 [Brachyspira aalborgi]